MYITQDAHDTYDRAILTMNGKPIAADEWTRLVDDDNTHWCAFQHQFVLCMCISVYLYLSIYIYIYIYSHTCIYIFICFSKEAAWSFQQLRISDRRRACLSCHMLPCWPPTMETWKLSPGHCVCVSVCPTLWFSLAWNWTGGLDRARSIRQCACVCV